MISDPVVHAPESPEDATQAALIDTLATRGWCVVDGFLSPIRAAELRESLFGRWSNDEFRAAGVGRGDSWELRPDVRTDRVRWLDPATVTPAEAYYLARMEALRMGINQALFLGLFDFEAHFAVYPPGTYYRKHLDQFVGRGNRTLSAVLYLNEGWGADDGGELRLYTDPADETHSQELVPQAGRLVLFLSARFLHEVLPAKRERMSVTGWFRTREVGRG